MRPASTLPERFAPRILTLHRASRGLWARLTAGALAALTLAACMSLAGGSSSTETGEQVALNGRVTGGAGEGLAGVIVSLQGSTLADTTDITGSFALHGRRPVTTDASVLRFVLGGQTIAQTTVTTLRGTLPDVVVVQRGFSGGFTGQATGIARVEGVVTGDGIAPGDSITATFFFNPLAGNYSGFVWFPPPTTTVRHYIVRVHVYDSEGLLTGRSVDVPFTSQAGNVVIPDFNPANLSPPAKRSVVSRSNPQNMSPETTGDPHESP